MITVEGLRVVLGGAPVLTQVDLDAHPGELIGLVGPNGAGKSTLLRAIAGLIRPAAGRVLIHGAPVGRHRPRALARQLAYLPQETAVTFPFTAYQVALTGRHPHLSRFRPERPADHAAATAALTDAGVAELADRLVTTLSGGERQRVLLARALAQDTPVLLADEPVAALDLRHQLAVLRLLRERATRGHTVIAVLHDLNLAARYCTRLALLADGHTTAVGTPDQVLTPARLRAAYQIQAVVRPDPLTGAPTVTALTDLESPPSTEGAH